MTILYELNVVIRKKKYFLFLFATLSAFKKKTIQFRNFLEWRSRFGKRSLGDHSIGGVTTWARWLSRAGCEKPKFDQISVQ